MAWDQWADLIDQGAISAAGARLWWDDGDGVDDPYSMSNLEAQPHSDGSFTITITHDDGQVDAFDLDVAETDSYWWEDLYWLYEEVGDEWEVLDTD